MRTLFLSAAVVALSPMFLWAQETAPSTPADRPSLEAAFVKQMTGAVLTGKFTVLDQEVDTGPKPDKYTITKVEKKEGDVWLFIARVEYERGTFPVALKIPVLWAGTTAVISLTDMEIPLIGSGVFNARVLIDGDRYAGTWSHDKVGGHMFGRIEKAAPIKSTETSK